MTFKITILSRDGQTLVAHYLADDWKHAQGICTIERSKSLSTRILITPPAGRSFTWD